MYRVRVNGITSDHENEAANRWRNRGNDDAGMGGHFSFSDKARPLHDLADLPRALTFLLTLLFSLLAGISMPANGRLLNRAYMGSGTAEAGGGKARITGTINKPGASVTVAGRPAAVHPQGGFAVEVDAAPGANHFPLVVTEADGTVTTKHVDLTFDQGVPLIQTYDANGNMESIAPQSAPGSPTRSYQWDAEDRLVGITRIISPTETRKTEFDYNGMGERVGKREVLNGVAESEIKYLYGGTGVLQERSADGGTVLKTYTGEGEQDFAKENGQTITTNLYYTYDHLGSVREVWDENGGLVARYDYTPYGERILVSGSHEAAKGYTGHDYDAPSGLILTRYRAYDPGAARWLSRDPLEEAGGMNLYGYVGNNPINAFDPDGQFAILLAAGNGNTAFEHWLGGTLHDSFGAQGTGSYVDGVARSSAAMMDGIIPFADPFASRGDYDPCDDGMELSNKAGEYGRDFLLLFAGGANAESRLSGSVKNWKFRIGKDPGAIRFSKGWNSVIKAKNYRLGFGSKNGFIHGHINPTNLLKPWQWVQKIGKYEFY